MSIGSPSGLIGLGFSLILGPLCFSRVFFILSDVSMNVKGGVREGAESFPEGVDDFTGLGEFWWCLIQGNHEILPWQSSPATPMDSRARNYPGNLAACPSFSAFCSFLGGIA